MKLFFVLFSFCGLFFFCGKEAYASVTPSPVTDNVKVTARVGEFYLNVSGIISPFASLSLSSEGNVYKATTADGQGRFAFSNININRGFSSFCIDAVDIKRLGVSYTCFSFKPADENIEMTDVFLPPTLGVSQTQITEGGDVIIFGYTMPHALTTIYISQGNSVQIESDSSGHYEYRYTKVKRGSYELIAGARYEGKDSLLPTRKINFKAIAVGAAIINAVKAAVDWLVEFAPLLALILLTLITVFVIWRDKILIFFRLRKRKLHHAWLVGY